MEEGGTDVRFLLFHYESLSKATNFAKWLVDGGCGSGSVFRGSLVSGTRVTVKMLELDGLPEESWRFWSVSDPQQVVDTVVPL